MNGTREAVPAPPSTWLRSKQEMDGGDKEAGVFSNHFLFLQWIEASLLEYRLLNVWHPALQDASVRTQSCCHSLGTGSTDASGPHHAFRSLYLIT